MTAVHTDEVAARVHQARAEKCFGDAEKFRHLRRPKSQAKALYMARLEDEIAYMLSTGKEPPRLARC